MDLGWKGGEGRNIQQQKKATYLVHIFACFSRCFDVWHTPLLGAGLTFRQWHLPFIVQIAFIADQQERYVFIVLHAQYLFPVELQPKCGMGGGVGKVVGRVDEVIGSRRESEKRSIN